MSTPKLIVFAGSARKGSWNKKLAAAAASMARDAGAEVTHLDLADYPMPIMDEDLEAAEGLPRNALRLKDLFKAHDGFLIASPEYNSSISPLLKNTIDWVSRPAEGEAPLEAYRGKVAALLAASPGALGGLRGLVTVRSILGNIGVFVTPSQLAVSHAHQAFAADGSLSDARTDQSLEAVVAQLVGAAGRLAG